ncbi:hypothetical protein HK405_010715 [Cladochytrium tenue]|nr:hypothetical protein HK405_010715 [Cladochytrium tenue]
MATRPTSTAALTTSASSSTSSMSRPTSVAAASASSATASSTLLSASQTPAQQDIGGSSSGVLSTASIAGIAVAGVAVIAAVVLACVLAACVRRRRAAARKREELELIESIDRDLKASKAAGGASGPSSPPVLPELAIGSSRLVPAAGPPSGAGNRRSAWRRSSFWMRRNSSATAAASPATDDPPPPIPPLPMTTAAADSRSLRSFASSKWRATFFPWLRLAVSSEVSFGHTSVAAPTNTYADDDDDDDEDNGTDPRADVSSHTRRRFSSGSTAPSDIILPPSAQSSPTRSGRPGAARSGPGALSPVIESPYSASASATPAGPPPLPLARPDDTAVTMSAGPPPAVPRPNARRTRGAWSGWWGRRSTASLDSAAADAGTTLAVAHGAATTPQDHRDSDGSYGILSLYARSSSAAAAQPAPTGVDAAEPVAAAATQQSRPFDRAAARNRQSVPYSTISVLSSVRGLGAGADGALPAIDDDDGDDDADHADAAALAVGPAAETGVEPPPSLPPPTKRESWESVASSVPSDVLERAVRDRSD